MTVEKKINLKDIIENALETKSGVSQISCGYVSYDEGDITVSVDHFTPSQVKVFDYLSSLLELDNESFGVLADCCQSIVEGDGVYLDKSFENTPCLANLVSELEQVYETLCVEEGVLTTHIELNQINNVKALLDNGKIMPLLRKVKAEKIMSAHSFAETGLMSLLSHVRKDKVVPCVDFRGIKQEDRTLWYALLSVGRKVIALEAYMLVRIWKLELSHGKPILAVHF